MKARRWFVEHRCSACDVTLTEEQRSYSGGVCLHCGGGGSGTFVPTRKLSYFLAPTGPAWQFWKPKKRVYKAEEAAERKEGNGDES